MTLDEYKKLIHPARMVRQKPAASPLDRLLRSKGDVITYSQRMLIDRICDTLGLRCPKIKTKRGASRFISKHMEEYKNQQRMWLDIEAEFDPWGD